MDISFIILILGLFASLLPHLNPFLRLGTFGLLDFLDGGYDYVQFGCFVHINVSFRVFGFYDEIWLV